METLRGRGDPQTLSNLFEIFFTLSEVVRILQDLARPYSCPNKPPGETVTTKYSVYHWNWTFLAFAVCNLVSN